MNSDWLKDNFEYLDHILINESNESMIYADQEMKDAIGEVKDYNNKIASVIKHVTEDGKKKILIEQGGIIVGWIVFEQSIPLFNKPEEKIEVEYEKFYSPKINKLINKNGDYNLYFQRYQVSSRFYAYHQNELLEAIFRKNTFVAFAPSKVIDRMKIVDKKSRITHKDIELYVTSKMDETLTFHQLDINEDVTIEAIFPILKRAKIKQDLVTGWVNFNVFDNIDFPEIKENDTNDEFIRQQHKDYIYINEQNKVKIILKKLLNENIALEKKINKQRDFNKKIIKRYENLRNSKLGKIQLLIWEKRSKRGNK
ncbi:hypothetical protein ETI06_02195 [Macrococcoides goetzii]|nr:hypothetical protein [Macrococcus goetzii]TDM50809.1 hypothetical protein ETI06_02195 [Macrococcus goetzii]